ncbi:MAG: hypothetical protein Q8R67_21210 [Rhodoferax sp.]|nr:hypothetical protein [Rhodoferax sp.]MDP3654197.1 hypothetical protein [Rhodoferax sp.]
MASAPPHNDEPLGLTVHSMPAPAQVAATDSARTRMGRWKMLLVFLICASPVIASYFTYYVIRPEGRRNFGDLVDPQRPLPDLVGTPLAGPPVNLRTLKGQWLLVSVSSGACDAACARHLYLQRQLREGLGKEKDRLDWVWLVSDATPVADELKPALQEATVVRLPAADLARWLEPQQGHALSEHLYLVDPLGNWMLRFPPQLDAQSAPQAKRDLDRLLRASASWDTAGR